MSKDIFRNSINISFQLGFHSAIQNKYEQISHKQTKQNNKFNWIFAELHTKLEFLHKTSLSPYCAKYFMLEYKIPNETHNHQTYTIQQIFQTRVVSYS